MHTVHCLLWSHFYCALKVIWRLPALFVKKNNLSCRDKFPWICNVIKIFKYVSSVTFMFHIFAKWIQETVWLSLLTFIRSVNELTLSCVMFHMFSNYSWQKRYLIKLHLSTHYFIYKIKRFVAIIPLSDLFTNLKHRNGFHSKHVH
jgi:hypothetical protein